MSCELLLPAGNLKKLKTAFHFGADAVYIGGKAFSLRAFADNFSDEDIRSGVEYAHSLGKKIYVTVNIFARDADILAARNYIVFLARIGADGVIVSDVGLLSLCREVAPNLDIHLSTQANTLNSRAVRFWLEQGVKRTVLGRELSLEEIMAIRSAVPQMEFEAFVHGAMCVSYSGRCLLSTYFSGRSANRGECIQPCRWGYRIAEDKQPDKPLDVEQDARGTYFMNSRDLNLLSRVPALIDAGLTSFKVEGRMKSEFYIATVAKTYRRAIDSYLQTGKIQNLDRLEAALETISHRPYTNAYFDGENIETISENVSKLEEKAKFIAIVEEYHNGLIAVEMRNRFRVGDILTVLSPNEGADGKEFAVTAISIKDSGETTDDALLVQRRYILPCPYSLLPGDLLVKY